MNLENRSSISESCFCVVSQASDILILRFSAARSLSLGPQSFEPPLDLISVELQRIPFIAQSPDPNIWTDQLRAWPFPMEGWTN